MARENHPVIRMASARQERSDGQLVQAGLYPNTRIGYHATEIGHSGTAGAQGFFLSQRFLQKDKRQLDIQIAEEGVQQASYEAATLESRALNDLRLRFYEALVARRQVHLAKQLLVISEEALASSQTLMEAGRIGEHVLLQSALERDKVRNFMDAARHQQMEAWRRLCVAVGVDDLDIHMLIGDLEAELPEWTWQQMLATLLSSSPELAAAEASVLKAQRTVQRADAETKLDYDVMLSLRHANMLSDDVANIQVGFPIPYFDRNQGNIQAAQAELVLAQQGVRQLQLRLRDQLSSVFRQYRDSQRHVARYREEMVPRANRSMLLVRQGYQQGQLDYLSLLTTQRTYYQVHLDYLKSLGQLHRTKVLLEGQLLSGSLTSR